ncbi:ABC transporter ATP-binding protein [Larkinella soli]|uniref:ABC transporter ATP-binding protein n=1 Tax=Larkinella soli TaxID=1770527 RepID=UPI000FFCA19E|nr:ABC transporter ATP-binding protein [Larkinella soli]
MSDTVIQIENVSKLYQLGATGTGSFKKDLQRWWNISILKKDDPYFQDPVLPDEGDDEEYDYDPFGPDAPALAEQPAEQTHIWALNKVSFDVKRGEVWGIVGDNGSGKSTLLKIISRIILPTSGVVHGKGRVSSLLEVGAGFHDELSGKENIFLSGYVLGMKKHEILKRYDEIVEFSGIGPFINTPVKRYSSGMYVRLAFSVAAHLDADIMVLDEVLSVGDAQFQRKCIAKIQEFAQQDDRTILFVSHNAQAVTHLCQKALWLDHGSVRAMGPVQAIINQYQPTGMAQADSLRQAWGRPRDAPGSETVRIKLVELVPQLEKPLAPIDVRTPLTIRFQLWLLEDNLRLLTGLHLFTAEGDVVLDVMSPFEKYEKGLIEGECAIPGNFLNDGSYYISLIVYSDKWEEMYYHRNAITFTVEDHRAREMDFEGKWMGAIRPTDLLPVRLIQIEENQVARAVRPVSR